MKKVVKILLSISIICIISFISVNFVKHANKKDIKLIHSDLIDTLEIKRVHNIIILDGSGSMYAYKSESVMGVNAAIKTIKEAHCNDPKLEHMLTMYTFSTDGNKLRLSNQYYSQDIQETSQMNLAQFRPQGMTPLYDALGSICKSMEKKIDDESLVLVTIITDGKENASQKFNKKKIKRVIERLDSAGWVFTYIGANQDAFMEAESIGIKNALEYETNSYAIRRMWEKERDSRRSFYGRIQGEKDKSRLKEKYFEK